MYINTVYCHNFYTQQKDVRELLFRFFCWHKLQVIAHVPESGKENTTTWKRLDEEGSTQSVLSGIKWRLLKCDVPVERRHPKYGTWLKER